MMRRVGPYAVLVLFVLLSSRGPAAEPTGFEPPTISVPDGFSVELAAAPPLVEHPLMAGFDEKGRLYIAENAGINMQRKELEEKLPNYISRLEDTNGDGKFDKRTVFADKLTFPQGALWHDGWLYVASSGAIWRFKDKNDDGVADVREKIVSSFGYTGNAADVHGCFLGLDGRIYWCEGRHGHEIVDSDGKLLSKGKAARIFSCRTDGSDMQIHCGGGMDNPVEVDWTDEGEMLGTVNIFYQKRGDCLVHWMHGGVYPRHDQPAVLAEFRKTGEPLDAVFDYGHVAVSGTCRTRGEALGPDFRGNFFVTEFNTHKIVRTRLTRDGSTFRAETSDFLQAASDDFHPTDVLEDADGSLLVIDTGGWFRIGCPTSQIAKPNILGAIYRVRAKAAQPVADPRGLRIPWADLDGTQLAGRLGDARPAVRERAIATLARQKDASIPYLSELLKDEDPVVRRNAVWTLTRIATPKAQTAVRRVLGAEKEKSVLLPAVYSTGVTADPAAVDRLMELLGESDTPAEVVREAATALGKIGDAAAVPALLEFARREMDRVLEHSVIYALIEIADRDATAKALADDSPRVRRASLIALDQMPDGNLTRDEVALLLDTSDPPLLSAALDVISRRTGWSDELVTLAEKLLLQDELSESEQSLLSGALVGLATNPKVQSLITEALGRDRVSEVHRALLLDVIVRSDLHPPPAAWVDALRSMLKSQDNEVAYGAILAAGGAADAKLDAAVLVVAREANRPIETRLAALAALGQRLTRLSESDFQLLVTGLESESPLNKMSAARSLGDAKLTDDQLFALIDQLESKQLSMLPALEAAFRDASPAVRERLAKARLVLPSSSALGTDSSRDQEIKAQLDELERNMPSGNLSAGRQVFFSRKQACSACHRVGNEGGKIGPDLSKVGERRSQRDLLEAVLVPSASIARGFESYAVLTADGQSLTCMIIRQTKDSLFVRTSDQREVRLSRGDVEAMKPSQLSIMPTGLDKAMSRQELADLLAFLQSLK